MPGTGSHLRGLRSSCDHCHQSKLKCVPTLAGCQRCLNNGLQCVHSPPGRSGRLPAAERKERANGPAAAILTPPRSRSAHTSSENDAFFSSGQGSEDDGGDMRSRNASVADDAAVPGDSHNNDTHLIDPLLEGRDTISSVDPSMLYGSYDTTNLVDLSMPPPRTRPNGVSPNASLPDFPMADMSAHTPIGMPSHINAQQLGRQMQSLDTNIPKCSCFHSIVRSLEQIQNPTVRHLSPDVALSYNKNVLIAICNSLKCASSHDSTTRLLTLVLVQRALYLYRVLYQSGFQNHHNEPNREPASPFSTTSTSWSGTDASASLSNRSQDYFGSGASPLNYFGGPSKSRLSLGSYQLDYADESSLTKQILILDLNKIPRLLERLDRRACGSDDTDGLDLYNLMRSALIAEFRSLMSEAAAPALEL